MKRRLFFIIFVLISSLTIHAETYKVGFYTDFEPISYAASRIEGTENFDQALGYEPDLLRAIERASKGELCFEFQGIKVWENIWMAPIQNNVDIGIGGITIEDTRTKDSSGDKKIVFTKPTVDFHQSLLCLFSNKNAIKHHKDLNCSDTVGAVRGTTGEYRFLTQTGIINNLNDGLIKKGVTVVLKDRGFKRSDGNLSIYSEELKSRKYLIPSDCSLPLVRYFLAEDSMIPALLEKHISAIARGYIGNRIVAEQYPEDLVVTAIYSLECEAQGKKSREVCKEKEQAGMTVNIENEKLFTALNKYILFLTDEGAITYEKWLDDPQVFEKRADLYLERNS
ncbi:MAG: hypothetical protein CMO81_01655 [Waddliaceae bacterium]|nr:hypothetical protein [Waddliaceae bacterium]